MKSTTKLIQTGMLTLFVLAPGYASDEAGLRKLLDEFLAGASTNSVEQHDRFWADELIYTSSSGKRFDKAHIMKGLKEADNDDSITVYRAEEVDIRLYGDTAIVAFKLVGEATDQGKAEVTHYFNTGTLLKRKGQWKVIAWQATRIPAGE